MWDGDLDGPEGPHCSQDSWGDQGLLSAKPGTSGPHRSVAFVASCAICVGGLQRNHSLIVLELLVQRQSTFVDTNRQEARQTSGFVNN